MSGMHACTEDCTHGCTTHCLLESVSKRPVEAECTCWHRAKEQELQHVQRSWSAASQQEGSNSSEAERARQQVKALEGQLRDLHSRLTRLQADTRCSVYTLGSAVVTCCTSMLGPWLD